MKTLEDESDDDFEDVLDEEDDGEEEDGNESKMNEVTLEMKKEIEKKKKIFESYLDARRRTGLLYNRVQMIDEKLYTKIHVDFLEDEAYLKYRREMLNTTGAPGLYYYGKEGYWKNEHMEQQVNEVIDIYEVLHPNHQIVFEFDHSMNHLKFAEDAIKANKLRVKFGCNEQKIRPTKIISEECIGPANKRILNVGDIQSFYYDKCSKTPNYPNHVPEEWIGKNKELSQLLWERGLYNPYEMRCKGDMEKVFMNLPDIKSEKCILEKVIIERGHIMILSPKCHCELAGNGIEYCWAYSQEVFIKSGEKNSSNLENKVMESLSKDILTLELIWKFERKARDYMRMYWYIKEHPNVKITELKQFENLRKHMKTYRCHRDIAKLERNYIRHVND